MENCLIPSEDVVNLKCNTTDEQPPCSCSPQLFDDTSLLLVPTMKKKKKLLKEKRQDLQGIRGLAILSVLGFHFLPSIFPNGYLGVDHVLLGNRIKQSIKYFMTFVMIGIMVYPYELSDKVMRPFFTVTTGLLMTITENNSILSSALLTYIGDISYSLYLIHWPMYAFWKLDMSDGSVWNGQLILVFLLALLVSILSYEIFEKYEQVRCFMQQQSFRWYLKLAAIPITCLCVSLFVLNILVLNRDKIQDWIANRQPGNFKRLDGLDGNRTYNFEESEYLNRRWSKDDIKNLIHPTCEYETGNGPFGWCRHTGLKGKFKFMIIGNSWAANHARIIYEECGYKAKSILQGSAIGCDPLYSYSYGGKRCKDNVKIFEKRIAEEKPDYVFLLSRFIDISDSINATSVENDVIYQSMKKQTEKLMENVKYKMFILTSIPEIEHENVEKIVRTVKNRKNLTKFDKSFVHASPESARRRHSKLIEDCKRCIPIDYKPLFWNTTTNTWRYYDVKNSGLSYMTQIDHLNFHGLELVRSLYTSICKKL
ncbi:hypothetical protein GCK72_013802 [Caenorhabditis remanei]|uniref:Uncharacterized protein n=1 Tax=Caenorhabditis remanei TaxID=31234 RepID=A0A6A5GQ78_CAERE|nr:hypothetical protein GCK72_013802 [Caenorhabditis remanei]KAF1757347.1 hypothetical protein GCK72_013802 [Caenorhabditis remanei]